MTPEAQQIAIAKACGWKDVKYTKHKEVDIENRSIIRWSGVTGIPPEFTHYKNRIRIPDYLNDLNAMHEAEKVLTDEQMINYLDALLDVLGLSGWYMDIDSVWQMTHATAAQRAEALLRTINKWEAGQ
jgi:hypothetical protein